MSSTLSIKDSLYQYLEDCQKAVEENEEVAAVYPEDFNIMPYNALILARQYSLKKLCSIIEEGVKIIIESDRYPNFTKDNPEEAIAFLVNTTILQNQEAITEALPHTGAGLNAIFRKYPAPTPTGRK